MLWLRPQRDREVPREAPGATPPSWSLHSPKRSAGRRAPLSRGLGLEPTYPGAPGRRPPARAAGPGAAGAGRLRAVPACWLSPIPAGDRERRQRGPCLGVPGRHAGLRGALGGRRRWRVRGAGLVRDRRPPCRRGRCWRPGAARSWRAGGWAARPGALWPGGSRGGGAGPRLGRPPWLGSPFAGKRGRPERGAGRQRGRRECGEARDLLGSLLGVEAPGTPGGLEGSKDGQQGPGARRAGPGGDEGGERGGRRKKGH